MAQGAPTASQNVRAEIATTPIATNAHDRLVTAKEASEKSGRKSLMAEIASPHRSPG